MQKSAIRVNECNYDDAAIAASIDSACFGAAAFPQIYFAQAVSLFGAGFMIGTLNATPVGYIIAAREQRNVDRGMIVSVAVSPSSQNQGVGRLLMEVGNAWLKVQGCKAIWLTVEPTNKAAITLYTSLGFRSVGQLENYGGPDDPRLMMEMQS